MTVKQFRKKPVVIEAVQYDGTLGSGTAIMQWMGRDEFAQDFMDSSLEIETLEGAMKASVGDWIIKGVAGEFYPCKPDIFASTYEPVE